MPIIFEDKLVPLGNNRATFSGSGTFTSPAGNITPARIILVGGGAGGGGSDLDFSTGGGGGGGGQIIIAEVFLSPSTVYTITIGAGGTGGIGGSGSSNNGTAGGNSSFGSITALGGKSGQVGNSIFGGAGGGGTPGGTYNGAQGLLPPGSNSSASGSGLVARNFISVATTTVFGSSGSLFYNFTGGLTVDVTNAYVQDTSYAANGGAFLPTSFGGPIIHQSSVEFPYSGGSGGANSALVTFTLIAAGVSNTVIIGGAGGGTGGYSLSGGSYGGIAGGASPYYSLGPNGGLAGDTVTYGTGGVTGSGGGGGASYLGGGGNGGSFNSVSNPTAGLGYGGGGGGGAGAMSSPNGAVGAAGYVEVQY